MNDLATPVTEFEQSPTLGKFAEAMAAAQMEMENATKDAENPAFSRGNKISRYADLAAVRAACMTAMNQQKIAAIQQPLSRGDLIGVRTLLVHASGEYVAASCFVKPSKVDAQGAGSVITYLRRYSLAAAAGIAQEDDDGNAASGVGGNDNGSPKAPQRAQSAPASAPVAVKPIASVKITSQHVQQLQIEARKRLWEGANAEEQRASRLKLWAGVIKREVTSATELLESEFDAVMACTVAQPALAKVAS